MTDMTDSISDQQAQELMDAIADKCEQMELSATQILDGIARSLLAANIAFESKQLAVDIEGIGKVNVEVTKPTDN